MCNQQDHSHQPCNLHTINQTPERVAKHLDPCIVDGDWVLLKNPRVTESSLLSDCQKVIHIKGSGNALAPDYLQRPTFLRWQSSISYNRRVEHGSFEHWTLRSHARLSEEQIQQQSHVCSSYCLELNPRQMWLLSLTNRCVTNTRWVQEVSG